MCGRYCKISITINSFTLTDSYKTESYWRQAAARPTNKRRTNLYL